MLKIEDGKLIFRYDAEEVWIEAWGENALRVRATKECRMPEENWALYRRGSEKAQITLDGENGCVFEGDQGLSLKHQKRCLVIDGIAFEKEQEVCT